MYSLLVLGIIPGTNIQISFSAWMILGVIFALALLIKNRVEFIDKLEQVIEEASPLRGMHATQLHRRGV